MAGAVDMLGGDVGIRLDVVGIKHAQNYPAEEYTTLNIPEINTDYNSEDILATSHLKANSLPTARFKSFSVISPLVRASWVYFW